MSRLLIALVLLLAAAAQAQTTGTWTQLPPGPTPVAPGRYYCTGFTNCTALSNRATSYPKSYSATVYGTPGGRGTLYYFGGGHGDHAGNDVELYDIATNTWTQQYPPESLADAACALPPNPYPTDCTNAPCPLGCAINGCSPFDAIICWMGPADIPYGNGNSYIYTYPAGRPYTMHAYGETAYDPTHQVFVYIDQRAGVSVFDPATHLWTAYPRPSGFQSGGISDRAAFYDPVAGLQLLDSYPRDDAVHPQLKTWNWDTHTLTLWGHGPTSFYYTDNTGSPYEAYDSARHRHLILHRGGSRKGWYWYDATTGTPPTAGTWTDITSSVPAGLTALIPSGNDSGPSFDYDPDHDRFVLTVVNPTAPYVMHSWTLAPSADPAVNTWAELTTNTLTGEGAKSGYWHMLHYDTVGHQFIFTDTGGSSGASGQTSQVATINYTLVLDGPTVTATIPGTATVTPTVTPTRTVTVTPTITPTQTTAPTPCGVSGTTWHVGPSRVYKAPCEVLGDGTTKSTLVRDCDTVEIDSVACNTTADCTAAGFAPNTSLCIDSVCAYLSWSQCTGARWPILCSGCSANHVTVRGVGGPVILDANGNSVSAMGIFRIDANNAVLENLTFQCESFSTLPECHGQYVGDDPGAGVRLVGTGLTVRNSVFRYNDNGILTGTSKNGLLDIQGSVFDRNGHGSGAGQTHSAYLSANTLIFRGNYMHSNALDASDKSGHYLKSRAAVNYVEGNRFMDQTDGHASFETDFPDGGLVYVLGNLYEKGALCDNTTMVRFHGEHVQTPNPIQELYVLYNTMVNDTGNPAAYFINADGGSTVVAKDNIMWGGGTQFNCGLTGTYGACTSTVLTNISIDPHLTNQVEYDYHILPGSPVIDAAVAPGNSPEGYPLAPTIQYVYDHEYAPRLTTADIGALPYSSNAPCQTTADCQAPQVCVQPSPTPG